MYLDETVILPHSLRYRVWAPKYTNIRVEKEGFKLGALAAIVCIISSNGIECCYIKERPISKADIASTLEKLSSIKQKPKFVIFLDNLRSQYSKLVKEVASSMGCSLLFNAPYSSSYHCIEEVFAQVKRRYKAAMCEAWFRISKEKHRELVIKSIMSIEDNLVRRIIDRGTEKIREYLK